MRASPVPYCRGYAGMWAPLWPVHSPPWKQSLSRDSLGDFPVLTPPFWVPREISAAHRRRHCSGDTAARYPLFRRRGWSGAWQGAGRSHCNPRLWVGAQLVSRVSAQQSTSLSNLLVTLLYSTFYFCTLFTHLFRVVYNHWAGSVVWMNTPLLLQSMSTRCGRKVRLGINTTTCHHKMSMITDCGPQQMRSHINAPLNSLATHTNT